MPNFLPSRQVREETGRARSMRVEVGKPSLKVRVPARDAPFFSNGIKDEADWEKSGQ